MPPDTPTNYRVLCTNFGPYVRGDVLPAHEVEVTHDANDLCNRGLLARTSAPVTVALAAKRPAAAGVPDDVYAERNRLLAERDGHVQELKLATGQAAEIERQRDDYKRQCGELAGAVGGWQRVAGEHEEGRVRAERERDGHKERADALAAECQARTDAAESHAAAVNTLTGQCSALAAERDHYKAEADHVVAERDQARQELAAAKARITALEADLAEHKELLAEADKAAPAGPAAA